MKSKTQKQDKMPILAHLVELRKRLFLCFFILIIGFGICYYFSETIYDFLSRPLFDVWQKIGGDTANQRMIATNLTEVFFTNIKLSFFGGLIITAPFLLWQCWMFIAPGLYKNEKPIFVFLMTMTPVFFTLGAAFVYYLVFPVAWRFFLNFEDPSGATILLMQPKVSEYLTLVLHLILAFGIAFETPVILLLLLKIGIIDRNWLKQKRRYAILGAFVMAAILTPPDPLSQIAMALPLILLYELALWVSYIFGWGNPSNPSKR